MPVKAAVRTIYARTDIYHLKKCPENCLNCKKSRERPVVFYENPGLLTCLWRVEFGEKGA